MKRGYCWTSVRWVRHPGLTSISAFTGLRRANAAAEAPHQTSAESVAPNSEEVGLAIEVAVMLDDAERVQGLLQVLKIANPGSPIPYVLAFDCWHRLKRSSLRNVAEAEFFARFGRDIHGGVFDGDQLRCQFRKSTLPLGSADELGVFFSAVLRENGVDPRAITQTAVCSVVPAAVHALRHA